MSRKGFSRTKKPKATLADNDLMAITRAKELCSYVLLITKNMPKHFRHTLSKEMAQSALKIIRNLYTANETYIGKNNLETRYPIRRDLQQDAKTELKMLTYFAQLALKEQGIKPKQFQTIAQLAVECDHIINGWIASDRKRWFTKPENQELIKKETTITILTYRRGHLEKVSL